MKKTSVVVLACVMTLASCLDVENRPVLSMLGDANSLTLTTDDTLVIIRAITNGGRNDMWLNASAPAYEMTNAGGAAVCDPTTLLALIAPEPVRVPAGQGIVDERRFPIEDLPNCVPGNYSLSFVAHFRESETAGDSFTLRTSASAFTLQAP